MGGASVGGEESHPHRCQGRHCQAGGEQGAAATFRYQVHHHQSHDPQGNDAEVEDDGRVSSYCSQVTEGVQGCAVEFVLGLSQHHGQYKLEARHHQDYTRSLVMICL